MSRIAAAFERAQAEGRAAFVPYLTAGFPDAEAFQQHAQALLARADVLEVGLPYSDPLGDGPTIQRASEQVLEQGMHVQDVFEHIRRLRQHSDKAIVLMSYYNPIYCYPGGEEAFLRALQDAGADGIILPDLPPDEGESLIAAARALDLDTIFLLAPTSTDGRIALVSQACRGFIYAVSVTGVTGARTQLPSDLPQLVQRIKAASSLPVAVGFGVSNGATAHAVAEVADGVVVGSALISSIAKGEDVTALADDIVAACRKTVTAS